jgi:hypothetical protein
MDGYSATELAKMFNTTARTIYRKFEEPSIKKYVVMTRLGKRLEKEGLNELNLIMAESKVANNSKKKVNSEDDNDAIVETLKKQIQELKDDKINLKEDKTRMFEEIKKRDELLIYKEEQLTKMITLLEMTQNKILLLAEKNEKTDKKWWKFWKD